MKDIPKHSEYVEHLLSRFLLITNNIDLAIKCSVECMDIVSGCNPTGLSGDIGGVPLSVIDRIGLSQFYCSNVIDILENKLIKNK